MRTSIIDCSTKGIFFLFLLFMLTACTSREDIVLELDGNGTEGAVETEAESISGTGGSPDVGTGTAPETASSGSTGEPGAGSAAENRTAEQEAPVVPDIYVHICGAVENPGVYILAAGSRVYEGIAAAGGFREDACEDFVNQAGILQDGQRLIIPTEQEAAGADGSYRTLWQEEMRKMEETDAAGGSSGNAEGSVNINTATEKELSAIPGIGAGKAAAIVQYRQENGNFASIEDIMKVSGIKEGTFEKIKDKITVN